MTTGAGEGGDARGATVQVARWVLWALLLVTAAVTLFGLPALQRAVAAGRLPRAALAAPPVLLAIFIAGYAGYRFLLVRAGRYPAGKALVQVAVMALVLAIVVRVALVPAEIAAPPPGAAAALARSLASADPDVRALGAELARHRPRAEAMAQVPRLVELLEDASPAVRREAHATLVALAGRDAGGTGPGAAARWREHFRRAGAPVR
jgi:hypothetical protein